MSETTQKVEVKGCRLLSMATVTDPRGHLTIADLDVMPFPVRRVFFIHGVHPHASRGQSAHRIGEELIFPITGSVLVEIEDGIRQQKLMLENGMGLLIGPKIWSVFRRFSAGAVIAVLASHPYDTSDSIRRYDDFLAVAAES